MGQTDGSFQDNVLASGMGSITKGSFDATVSDNMYESYLDLIKMPRLLRNYILMKLQRTFKE
uniref:Uncharacterized protein n=1 Tax=Oryza sativa subsp. indica TaxID=39946 RepID=A0A679B970_ORYSI|nr:hypothetical protein [Oryza sativa Indica Group]